jgi:hypothetical protein
MKTQIKKSFLRFVAELAWIFDFDAADKKSSP